MPKLTTVQLDEKTVIYIEGAENLDVPEIDEDIRDEETPVSKGGVETAIQKLTSIESTIRAYTAHTLSAFKELTVANVDKVSLEFGIKVGGEAGIPYVTKGTAESNLKVTVECSFPKRASE
jgi:hypothetical protein